MDEQMRKDYEAWREKSIWWTVCRPDQHDDSTSDAASTGRLMNIAAWESWQAAAALSQPAAQEIDELKTICAETYQVVGSLASDLGIFGSCLQLGKVLDNLSQQKRVHNDVLPWPSFEAQGDSSHPAGGEFGGVTQPGLAGEELALFRATLEGFADCGETDTDYSTLVDWALRGFLECTNFRPTAAAHRMLASNTPTDQKGNAA